MSRGALPVRLLAIISLALASAATCGAISADFHVTEIAPGVFVHSGRPLALDVPGHDDIANIGFIVGKRCVAVIDTGGSVRIGRALRAVIREHTGLPVCYVINTHVHVDHVLGNAAFIQERPQFLGHALLADALARSRPVFLSSYADDLDAPATAAQIIGPDRSVPLGSDVDLDLGGRRITLHAWPKAHTDCDLSVYDVATGTLWTGDLLFVRRTPAVDGSVKGWLAVIDTLAAMHVQRLVPGHGDVSRDPATAFGPERRYLQALLDGVRAEIAQGKPLQDALRDLNPVGKTDWLLWDATHPRNVARVYQELEWE
jgi:quinoprotein relay system zinc metallohydrolase 2